MQDPITLCDTKKLSRSPSITTDLGYYTLVPSQFLPTHSRNSNSHNISMREVTSFSTCTSTLMKQQFNTKPIAVNYFDKLIDELVIKIFSFLTTYELCSSCSRVSRRWYYLTWDSSLWQSLVINSVMCHNLNIDRGLTTLLRLLSRESYCRGKTQAINWEFSYNTYSSTDTSMTNSLNSVNLSLPIEKIVLNGCVKLTDKSLILITRKCGSKLKSIEIRSCNQVLFGINKILSKCINLEKMDITGCTNVTLNAIQKPEHHSKLRYLDLSDCHQLDDYSLKNFLKFYGQKLTHLYLRRCTSLTDQSIKSVATYCPSLKELSISYCPQLTDSVCYELSIELNSNLKYLSLAKCEQISDSGLKQIARHCYKLRYLNVRGCETVSDAGVVVLARSCGLRLKAIDLGKCDITDHGLKILSENCPNLRKLSVKECISVSDVGIMSIAYYCRELILLNIANCDNVTIDAYRYVKRHCRRCTIHHTNPGFS